MIRRATIVALAALACGGPALAQVSEGDVPQHAFREPLLNGKGVTSLQDLRGVPVLVEFWGTR